MRKYEQIDSRLFAWLNLNREGVTTSLAIAALGTSCSTTQRHISRRFTQLEDRGVLKCSLRGTTRVCSVEKDPPTTLAKQRWRQTPTAVKPLVAIRSIPAADSSEFEAAGGNVTKLPCGWDTPPGCRGIGAMTFIDIINALD